MTEFEIEKQSEKYADEHKRILYNDYARQKQAFQDGAKWCKMEMEHAVEWHNLKENPKDLPKYENSMMLRICWINPYGNICYHDAFYDKKGFYWVSEKTCRKLYTDEVIAWCELPMYKEV